MKKPYEPRIQVKLIDLYEALVMGDRKTLDRLTKLAHDEYQKFIHGVTKNPQTEQEWDEWQRRRV